MTAPVQRQHHTDKEFLKHFGRHFVNHDYHPTYRTDFKGEPTQHPPTHRRFTRNHKEGVPGLATLETQTSSWFKDELCEYETPLQVLAVSQEPFAKANKWKYSYHGLPKCYPPYDKISKNKPFSVWNLYGKHGLKETTTPS